MAVVEIAHKPQLTAAEVREIFQRHFDGVYTIEDLKGPMAIRRDFVVVKNPFVGVSVKLEQGTGTTKLVYTGLSPRLWARLLFSGLLSLFLWNGLTRQVREFIETAPEFK